MKKTALIILIFVLLTMVAFLTHYYPAAEDDTSRLEKLAEKSSVLVSGPRADRYAASLAHRGRPAILITRSWCKTHINPDKYGFNGTTGIWINVHMTHDEREQLFKLILNILSDSPKQAQWVFEHPDLRVRLLGLAAVRDCLLDDSRPARGRIRTVVDRTPLLEAIAVLVVDKDPFLAAGVLEMLGDKKFFRPPILRNGLAHGCTEVRFGCVLYAERVLDALDVSELRELIGALIEHIDEPDSVLRGRCYSALGAAVSELDHKLQGIETKRRSAFNQGEMKLPELRMRWENLAIGSWTRAHEVKQMWQSWFDSLPEYSDSSRGSEVPL